MSAPTVTVAAVVGVLAETRPIHLKSAAIDPEWNQWEYTVLLFADVLATTEEDLYQEVNDVVDTWSGVL